jgi:hypothetical protein
MKSVRQLSSWWSVSAWPKLSGDALVGNRAAAALGAESGQFELKFQGRSTRLNSVGTLETGAAEDSRIYVALPDFVAWTRVQPSVIEVAANGSAADINATIARIAQVAPEVEVRPIRQIVEAEGRVLGNTQGMDVGERVRVKLQGVSVENGFIDFEKA